MGTIAPMTEPIEPTDQTDQTDQTEQVEQAGPVYMTRADVATHFAVDEAAVTLRPDATVDGGPVWLRSRIESLPSPAEPPSIWG